MGQVGSRHDKVEYDVDNHVVYLSLDYMPMQSLRLYGDLTYNYSETDVDNPSFGSDLHFNIDPTSADPYSHAAAYFDSDFGDSNDWTELEYSQVSATVGLEWNFWKNFTLTSSFTYRWFDDDEEYLGEDTDGEAYIMNVGLMWKF